MDLSVYLAPLRKWWWLLVVASLLAAVSSFLVTRQQPPVYQARTTLVIGRSVFDPNPTSSDFWLGQQLATFYADFATREPIRVATQNALGLSWLPEYAANAQPSSQIIEIVVTDTSPERAQAVANELANQLIKQSPASRESQALEHQEFIQQQLYNIENEINDTLDELALKQQELGELFSARQIAEAEADLAALDAKLTTLQTNYAALLANSEQGASNTLSVIERAARPRRAIGPQTGMMVALTTIIGLVLSSVAAYLIEYLDDTLKSPEDIARHLNLPLVGIIAEIAKEDHGGAYVAKKPRSVVADAYRSLRTNLEFTAVDKPLKTIYVSSAGVSEGKTSVAINLAEVIAQGGKRVILLDADLRRPNVYLSLGLPNNYGLSDIFRGQYEALNAFTPWEGGQVRVILSGSPPPNPADLLGSKKMDSILEELKSDADVVIVDGPPFVVADASLLANKVDGVILIVRHGYSRRGSVKGSLERLKNAGANILGVVLTRTPRSSYGAYGHYGYDEYYSGELEKGSVEEGAARGRALPRFVQKTVHMLKSLPGNQRHSTALEASAAVVNSQKSMGNGSKPIVQPESQDSPASLEAHQEVEEPGLSASPVSEPVESVSLAAPDEDSGGTGEGEPPVPEMFEPVAESDSTEAVNRPGEELVPEDGPGMEASLAPDVQPEAEWEAAAGAAQSGNARRKLLKSARRTRKK